MCWGKMWCVSFFRECLYPFNLKMLVLYLQLRIQNQGPLFDIHVDHGILFILNVQFFKGETPYFPLSQIEIPLATQTHPAIFCGTMP